MVATNNFGTVSTNATLTVLSKPAFVSELEDVSVVEGTPVKLEVVVVGSPQPTVKWYQNGEEIIPDGRYIKASLTPDGLATLMFEKAQITDGGDLRVVASNESGTAASNALLSVTSKHESTLRLGEKPVFEKGLEDTEVDVGSSAKLEVKVTGLPKPKLTWLGPNGKEIVPEKGYVQIKEGPDGTSTLEIKEAILEDAGSYRGKYIFYRYKVAGDWCAIHLCII